MSLSDVCETVIIMRGKTPVTINKSDYDSKKHDLAPEDKPAAPTHNVQKAQDGKWYDFAENEAGELTAMTDGYDTKKACIASLAG